MLSIPCAVLRDSLTADANAEAAEDGKEILDSVPYMDTDDVTKSPRVVTLEAVDHRTTGQWAIYYVPPHFKPIIKMFHKVRLRVLCVCVAS